VNLLSILNFALEFLKLLYLVNNIIIFAHFFIMNRIFKIASNRNVILLSALTCGFLIPTGGKLFSGYIIYLLALIMSFSTTGVNLKMLSELKSVTKITLLSVFLNYIVQGGIILTLAWFFTDKATFYGFVVIAASPPGVAIIPFTYAFKGDLNYSFKGFLGTYLLSIILTPLIITVFANDANIDIRHLLILIVQIIVIPMVISRIFLLKKLIGTVEKLRGSVVDWGFALILYTAVALNKDIIINNTNTVISSFFILFVGIFLTGTVFLYVNRKSKNPEKIISKNLMLTVKSSGFAVATILALFDKSSAIPAAVLSIMVLLYIITMGFQLHQKQK
jgi:BASS family bile acid:Na+ symporter